MASEWTPESFELHIGAVFDEIKGKAKAANSTDEIVPLRNQLNREWLGAKPGAFLSSEEFSRIKTRLQAVENILTERFVELREAGGDSQVEERIVIDHDSPTIATFFYARHYSNKDRPWAAYAAQEAIQSVEVRLGIQFPQLLSDLYLLQNGGHTDFYLASNAKDPPYEFGGSTGADIDGVYDIWLSVLPSNDIAPLERLQTLGDFSDQIDFGNASDTWRSYIPGIDRLIPISSHGSDIWLCLDYREGAAEPKVVLFDDRKGDRSGNKSFVYEASDFASFFSALRRHGITKEYGSRRRGQRTLQTDE